MQDKENEIKVHASSCFTYTKDDYEADKAAMALGDNHQPIQVQQSPKEREDKLKELEAIAEKELARRAESVTPSTSSAPTEAQKEKYRNAGYIWDMDKTK